MIDWATIKPLVTGIISDLGGLSGRVRWMDEPATSTWGDQPIALLRVTPTETQGIEEKFYGDIPSNPAVDRVAVVAGQRRFMLTIRVESFEQDIASSSFAGNIAEQIRIGFQRTTTQERYRGAFAIENRLPIQWFDYEDDNERQVSCYIFEVQCRTVNNDVDTSFGAGPWINEAQIKSNKLYGPDGVQLPSQINLDVVGS